MAALPEELLDQICKDVIWTLDEPKRPKSSYEISCQTLFNLMISCKTFHRLAHPALYHTLVIGEEPGRSRITLPQLVELCVAHRSIASSVKQLDLGDHPSGETPNVLSPAVRSRFFTLCGVPFSSGSIRSDDAPENPDDDDDDENPTTFTNDTLAAIVLAFTPNLTSLSLSHLGPKTPRLSGTISFAATPFPPSRELPLRQLRHIHAHLPGVSGRALVLQDQLHLLSLPSLTSFTGTGFSAARGLRHFIAPANFRPSPLRKIVLRKGVLDWTGLEGLILAFPELVDLDVEVAEMGGVIGQCRIDFASLGEMLRKLGARLERFSFGCHPNSLRNDRRGEPVGELREMEGLRVLRVVWDGVFGSGRDVVEDGRYPAHYDGADERDYLVRVLPRGLRGLRIWDGPSGGPDDSDLQAPHRKVLAEQMKVLTGCKEFGELCTIVLPGLLGLGMPVPEGWLRVRNCGAFVIVKEGRGIAEGVLEGVKEMELTTARISHGKMTYGSRRTSQ